VTKIPAAIRKRHHIKEGDRLVWLDDGEVIRVVPVSADPITALRGSGRGEKLLERLLQNRREDREREEWASLSAGALEAAYGEDEPEYSLELVKSPNPDYEGR